MMVLCVYILHIILLYVTYIYTHNTIIYYGIRYYEHLLHDDFPSSLIRHRYGSLRNQEEFNAPDLLKMWLSFGFYTFQ